MCWRARRRRWPTGSRRTSAGRRITSYLIDGAMVSRSAPRSDGGSAADYALDRQLRRARQLHDDLTAIRTRNDYEGTLARARAKSEASPYATRTRTAPR